MKETRLFYLPALADGDTPDTILELPEEEAAHALRVLRLSKGDSLSLTDGQGKWQQLLYARPVRSTARYDCNTFGSLHVFGREAYISL